MESRTKHTVDVAGIPVGYYVEGQGDGTPLALLHGGTGHPETSFAGMIEHFVRSRTTLVPGYSGSDLTPLPQDRDLDVDMVADQVLGAVEASGQGPVDMYGISTGAVVAAAAAARRPDLVRRLVLMGGFLHYREPWQRMLVRVWLKLAEADSNAFAEYTMLHMCSDEYVDSLTPRERLALRAGLMPSTGMIALVGLVSTADISEHVSRIEAPTLVIGMTQDHLVPLRYARRFQAAIPGSEYVEIDSGHAAATEKPEELLKIIEEFLA